MALPRRARRSTPHHDPNDPRNSGAYHTGKECAEPVCTRPAGTAWSSLWCRECNARRLDRIEESLQRIEERFNEKFAR